MSWSLHLFMSPLAVTRGVRSAVSTLPWGQPPLRVVICTPSLVTCRLQAPGTPEVERGLWAAWLCGSPHLGLFCDETPKCSSGGSSEWPLFLAHLKLFSSLAAFSSSLWWLLFLFITVLRGRKLSLLTPLSSLQAPIWISPCDHYNSLASFYLKYTY